MHIVITKAEMMARFVNNDVTHKIIHSHACFLPFSNQWHTKQPYSWRHSMRRPDRLVWQRFALIQPAELPFVGQPYRRKLLRRGKILDLQNHIPQLIAKLRWQIIEDALRHRLHLLLRGADEFLKHEMDMCMNCLPTNAETRHVRRVHG